MTRSLPRLGTIDWRAPWAVECLPPGFDASDEAFEAVRMKWNMDREGQDWPNPRYVPQADGGFLIIAENVFDHGEGPYLWAMEVAPRAQVAAAMRWP